MTRLRLLLLVLAWATPALAAPPDEIHWTILGQTAVTFDWRGTDNQLSFGTAPGAYTRTVTAVAPSPLPDGTGPFWEARLTGLGQNTLYYYRIGSRPERTFRTPPPRGSADFWFAEEADVGSTLTYPQVGPTQDSIGTGERNVPGDDRPAFALVAGDLTYGDVEGATDVDQHFNDVMSWSERCAYMPAWGNHEWDPTGSVRPDQINNYKGRFDLPNPAASPGTGPTCIQADSVTGEDWYWFDYGNVRFISYPPGSEGACGYAGARMAWVTSAGSIMSAVDNDPQIHFIVTFGHFPPYSSGTDFAGDPARAADMAALHVAHPKYVLNLAGHSHHYERFDPAQTGGVLQIVAPGGGSTLGGLGTALPSTVVRFKHLEHLKLHVTSNHIEGYCICGPARPEEASSCTPGTVIDSWSVASPVLVDGVADAGVAPPSLWPVQPNPVRGSARLVFELPRETTLHLGVFDIQGRECAVLADGEYTAGPHRLEWSAQARETLSPGLYFLRLAVPGRTLMRRFVVAR